MNNKNLRYVLAIVVFALIALAVWSASPAASAPVASSSSPYVRTKETPNGVSVNMSLPNDFKGQVYTVYKDGKWQTYATTTPLSQADMSAMQSQIQAQQEQMQQLFNEQQAMLNQQEAMFREMQRSLGM